MHCAKSDWLVDRDRKGPRLTIRRDASTYSSTRRSSARDHYARLPGAIGATREALIAAFCRLAKSLSHSMQMGWLVGAVGIETTAVLETKEFCGAARPSKVLKGKGGNF